jgi:hypothetical protein
MIQCFSFVFFVPFLTTEASAKVVFVCFVVNKDFYINVQGVYY